MVPSTVLYINTESGPGDLFPCVEYSRTHWVLKPRALPVAHIKLDSKRNFPIGSHGREHGDCFALRSAKSTRCSQQSGRHMS